MSNLYTEWIDSCLFALEEAMGMAAECGYANDLAQLEMAHDAIASCAEGKEMAYALTSKGQAYLQRQRSIKSGREAKRAYDKAYSMVRAGQNVYMQMEIGDWAIVDAAHASHKNTFKDDALANVQRRFIDAYLERGMHAHYQLGRCNYYHIKSNDDSYIKRNRTVHAILRSLRDE